MARKPTVTMRRALSDPALLGEVLKGDSWRAWRILLVAVMGEPLDDDERIVFKRLTGRDIEPGQRVDEFWAVVGRRGGKSRAIATLIVYLAVFVDHSAVLVPGERPVALCLAPSRQQSAIVLGYIAGILGSVPMLQKLVGNTTAETLSLKNGIDIEVRTASFRNARGWTAVAIVGDEACFFYDEAAGSKNSDTEILDAIRPSLATTGGLLAIISSPYARRGEVYDTYTKHYGAAGDPLILVAQGGSRDFNPSLPQSIVDRAIERDAQAASAEYLGIFRPDLERYISLEAVSACVDAGCHERGPLSSQRYWAAMDAAGGAGQDSMTLAIGHVEDDVGVLDLIREFRPPFSPAEVVAAFAETMQAYRINEVVADKWGGDWVAEAFTKAPGAVACKPSEQTRSEAYQELLPLINSSKIRLLDDKRLISQLVSLERRTSRAGKDNINHSPGQHDDVINAAALVLILAAGKRGFDTSYAWVDGPDGESDADANAAWQRSQMWAHVNRTNRGWW